MYEQLTGLHMKLESQTDAAAAWVDASRAYSKAGITDSGRSSSISTAPCPPGACPLSRCSHVRFTLHWTNASSHLYLDIECVLDVDSLELSLGQNAKISMSDASASASPTRFVRVLRPHTPLTSRRKGFRARCVNRKLAVWLGWQPAFKGAAPGAACCTSGPQGRSSPRDVVL